MGQITHTQKVGHSRGIRWLPEFRAVRTLIDLPKIHLSSFLSKLTQFGERVAIKKLEETKLERQTIDKRSRACTFCCA
jgi:hypothetical protein